MGYRRRTEKIELSWQLHWLSSSFQRVSLLLTSIYIHAFSASNTYISHLIIFCHFTIYDLMKTQGIDNGFSARNTGINTMQAMRCMLQHVSFATYAAFWIYPRSTTRIYDADAASNKSAFKLESWKNCVYLRFKRYHARSANEIESFENKKIFWKQEYSFLYFRD